MVTTLKPNTRQVTVGCQSTQGQGADGTGHGRYDVEKVLHEVSGGAGDTQQERPAPAGTSGRRRGFTISLLEALATAYWTLSGPPMTQRERDRRSINEPYARYTADLVWSQRII